MGDLLYKNLQEVKKPVLKPEDYELAKGIIDSIPAASKSDYANTLSYIKDRALRAKLYEEHKDDVICEYVMPMNENEGSGGGSTDVADVSWNCPTQQLGAATVAIGTPGHSWQLVAQGKSNLAHEGMIYAARAMAGAAIDMIADPTLIEAAKAEFALRLDGKTYECPIPKGIKPRTMTGK